MAERFQDIFVGGDHAHGEWNKDTGDCKTLKSPASNQDYEDHLDGKRGLGLIPIREDGTCRFAAIDIDIDNIDHARLYEAVSKRRMPLTVCRSKSGGAHLYLFAQEPGMEAAKVIQLLKKWATLLGFPKVEIFPKQPKVTKQNLGNWINMPYFAGDKTVRYAVGKNGMLTMDEFLASVQFYDGTETKVDDTVQKDLVQIGEMPPCLAALTKDGLPDGTRNVGLFNFAVFYRKSSPNGWEDKVLQHNQKHVTPPLSYREVQAVIKSAGARKYQYQCDIEPLCSNCDRKTCVTLQYGVSHEPWKSADNYHEFTISHLRKIMTDPPRYIVEVNGNDMELETKQLLKFPTFRDRMFEIGNSMIAPMKQEQWEQQVMDLMSKMQVVEAPKDASMRGLLVNKFQEFLALSERSKGLEDLLKGLPVRKDGWIWFRAQDAVKFFQTQRFMDIKSNILFEIIHSMGGDTSLLRVKQKVVRPWRVPEDALQMQLEDFEVQKFTDLGEEL